MTLTLRFILWLLILTMFDLLAGCGSDSLSRDKAAAIIKSALEKEKIVATFLIAESQEKGILYINYEGADQYTEQHRNNNGIGDKFANARERWIDLERKGLLTYRILARTIPNNCGSPMSFLGTSFDGQPQQYPGQSGCPHSFNCCYYDAFSLEFTSSAKPYVELRETVDNAALRWHVTLQKTEAILTLAVLDKVTVTGLTAPSDVFGSKVVQAEYIVDYKPTPIGELYLTATELRKSGITHFALYDDGWRLAN